MNLNYIPIQLPQMFSYALPLPGCRPLYSSNSGKSSATLVRRRRIGTAALVGVNRRRLPEAETEPAHPHLPVCSRQEEVGCMTERLLHHSTVRTVMG